MNFFIGFGKGFVSFFKAFKIIFGTKLWQYIFYCLLLWILMIAVTFYFVGEMAESIKAWINEQMMLTSIPDEGHWLSWLKSFVNGYLGFLVSWIIKIAFWMISGTLMKYVTLILISPIMSLLSESVEEHITGKKYPFNFTQLLKDILRGVLINVRNMFIEYFFIAVGFFICLIFPPLSIVITPFLFLFGWYFIGFSMMDYSCERNKMGVIQSVRFVRKNKGIACGIGFCYAFFMGLPFIIGDALGMMIAPVMAVTGSTIAFIEIQQKEKNVPKAV